MLQEMKIKIVRNRLTSKGPFTYDVGNEGGGELVQKMSQGRLCGFSTSFHHYMQKRGEGIQKLENTERLQMACIYLVS